MEGNKSYRVLLFAAVVLTISGTMGGCHTEEVTGYPYAGGEPVPVSLKVPTRAEGDPAEDEIANVRVIIMRDNGDVLYNDVYLPEQVRVEEGSDNPEITVDDTFTYSLYPNRYHFFVAVNFEKNYKEVMDAIRNWDDLKDVMITKVALEENNEGPGSANYGQIHPESDFFPFPRSGYVRNVWIRSEELARPEDPGLISTDVGQTWKEKLEVDVNRTAARINIFIRKQTLEASDSVEITGIRLLQVPLHAYLISRTYDETGSASEYDFNTMIWYEQPAGGESNDWFTENSDTYVASNRTNIIVPEYILRDKTNPDQAVLLEIRGNYYNQTNGLLLHNMRSIVPIGSVLGGTDGNGVTVAPENADYNIYRNRSYDVKLTITKAQEYEFRPVISYSLAGWNDAGGNVNVGGAVMYQAASWTNTTPDSDGIVWINYGEYVELQFILSRENGNMSNIIWRASLSDVSNFDFDYSGGAVSEGVAQPGVPYKVRIKPKHPNAGITDMRTTLFYLVVDKGNGESIEIDMTGNYSTVSENFRIRQRTTF